MSAATRPKASSKGASEVSCEPIWTAIPTALYGWQRAHAGERLGHVRQIDAELVLAGDPS